MISAVIVNFNEAEKLKKCLKSLEGFADEVVVLDFGSTDGSTEIYKEYEVKVFKHDPVPYVESVRNYAVSKAKGDWILVLDPDEILTSELKNKLKTISEEDNFTAVNIPRKNIFFGRWISHSNWWPDRQVRFFKKGAVKWKEKIHQYPEVSGRVLDLDAKAGFAIVHFSYNFVNEFMTRQNRYSTIEAKNHYDNGVKFSIRLFFWKPVREFLVRFIRHAGFLDGFYGFGLTILMMVYQMEVMVKLWELEREK